MTDPGLMERAAGCYLRGGLPGEAARCLRAAGAFRRAAELWLQLGEFREAARDYVHADMTSVAAWTLVHHAGEAEAARVLADPRFLLIGSTAERAAFLTGERADLARWSLELVEVTHPPRVPTLHERLVLARCDAAEGRADRDALVALGSAADVLASEDALYDRLVEEWAVAVAEQLRRYDQVALLFAAAVRGRRAGAAERWREWAARVLDSEITVPEYRPEPASSPHGPVSDLHRFQRRLDEMEREARTVLDTE